MIQATVGSAPSKRFSKGPYATTTARFNDSADVSATAWQGSVARSPEQRSPKSAMTRRLASPAASTVFVALLFPVDAFGSETGPFGNIVFSDVPQRHSGGGVVERNADADSEARPWRGVFELTPERDVLFSQVVELKTADLPSWEPHITLNRRWIESDDE